MIKKYKYNGYDIVSISSCGQVRLVYHDDVVELDDNDIKFQTLTNFEEVKVVDKGKKKVEESE